MISSYCSHLWQVHGQNGELGELAAWAAAVENKVAFAFVAALDALEEWPHRTDLAIQKTVQVIRAEFLTKKQNTSTM